MAEKLRKVDGRIQLQHRHRKNEREEAEGDEVGRIDAEKPAHEEHFEFLALGFFVAEVNTKSADEEEDRDPDEPIREGNDREKQVTYIAIGEAQFRFHLLQIAKALDQEMKPQDEENGDGPDIVDQGKMIAAVGTRRRGLGRCHRGGAHR